MATDEQQPPFDYDYDADAGDRIRSIMNKKGLPYGHPLHTAAIVAGRQLEWLKPLKLDKSNPAGIIAGVVANVRYGTVLIVLADMKRVVTIRVPPQQQRRDAWFRLATLGRDWITKRKGILGERKLQNIGQQAMQRILNEHGGPPAQTAPELVSDKAEWIIGMLCAGVPDLAKLVDATEQTAERGVCPVLIGLIGSASSGTAGKFSSCWPLFLTLAPYELKVPNDLLRHLGAAD
jgi:hypothetical protein